jgi:parvulin-like peptidyl-prolyl isomerase
MRRFVVIGVLALLAAALFGGCAKVEDRAILTITDNEGKLAARTVTVGYVNERLERMPASLLPSAPGDEGKKEFLDEIARKELLVMAGLRAGLDKDAGLEPARAYFEKSKAEAMLTDELVNKPSEPTQAELEEVNKLRGTNFKLSEIVAPSLEAADEAYRRVTGGGEDFDKVAAEVAASAKTQGGGQQAAMDWLDIHPLIAREIKNLAKGAVTKPIEIGGTYYVVKVLARKEPAEMKPLEGTHLAGVKMEATNFNRGIRDYERTKEWLKAANPVYKDDALALAAKKIGEKAAEIMPVPAETATFEQRMNLSSTQVVPEFTEDEAKLELVRYKVANDEHVWTLGDLQKTLSETPGMEGVKSDDVSRLKYFITNRILSEITQHEIETRGYKNTKELKEYVDQRMEEAVVELTYNSQVVQKVEEPSGEDVKQYYRSHLSDFVQPPSVDVQQMIVGTEAEANSIHQKLMSGQGTFTDLVRKYSIDEWSKAKDGVIKSYFQGERRLDYLQGVAFSLDVNQVSEPVRAPGGYAIVKLLAKYPEEQLAFDDVSNVVKESVTNLRREERLNQLLDELKGTVTITVVEKNLKHMKAPAELAQQAQEGSTQKATPAEQKATPAEKKGK